MAMTPSDAQGSHPGLTQLLALDPEAPIPLDNGPSLIGPLAGHGLDGPCYQGRFEFDPHIQGESIGIVRYWIGKLNQRGIWSPQELSHPEWLPNPTSRGIWNGFQPGHRAATPFVLDDLPFCSVAAFEANQILNWHGTGPSIMDRRYLLEGWPSGSA